MMNDFNKFPNFRFWTQRVLPCVFDESLSYVEKINKLKQMINDLIDEYNKFGQQVTNEVNTFEAETNQKIQDFINQVTQIINDFKQQVTTEITRFEKQVTDSQNEYEESMNALYAQFTQSINSTVEEFENRVTEQQNLFMTQINNRVNAMQAVVDDIPETVANTVNEVAIPWLTTNVPNMVKTQVSQDVCKVYDLNDTSIATTFNNDANNITNTGLYLLATSTKNIPSSAALPAYLFTTNLGGNGQDIVQYVFDTLSGIWTRQRLGGTGATWDAWYNDKDMAYMKEFGDAIDFNELNNQFGFARRGLNWVNDPSDLPAGTKCLIVSGTMLIGAFGSGKVQIVIRIDTGDIRFRMYNPASGVWNAWNGLNRNNFQIQRLVANTSASSLVNTGIYYTDSNSGVTISDLPNTKLDYGSIYIQTITNPDPTTVQYLYNTGDYGASIYSRQKLGNTWSTWKAIAPNVRYEETTNFTISGANPSYLNYYPTSISTIGLPDENIFDGFEVQAIVNIDGKSSTPIPMLYNANLVYNANSPNVITIGFKVFDYEAEAGKFYVKFRVLDWR
jgi:archaellum component FlaC